MAPQAKRGLKQQIAEGSQAYDRLMCRAEVIDLLGVSYPTVWKWMRAGKFPRAIVLSPGRVAWVRSEVMAALASLPRQRLKGDADA